MVLRVSGWLPSVLGPLRAIALPRLLRTQCLLTACLPLPWPWPGYSSCMQYWGWMFDYILVQIVLQALAICHPVHGPKKRFCTQSRVKTGASVVSLQGHGQNALLTASGPTVSVPWSPPELSGVCGSLPLCPQLSCGELSETAAVCSLALPPSPWPGGSAHSPSLPFWEVDTFSRRKSEFWVRGARMTGMCVFTYTAHKVLKVIFRSSERVFKYKTAMAFFLIRLFTLFFYFFIA